MDIREQQEKKTLSDAECERVWEAATKKAPIYVDTYVGKQVMKWLAEKQKEKFDAGSKS